VWLAGGTDFVVRAGQGLARPDVVISLKKLVPLLSGVEKRDKKLFIGGLSSLDMVSKDLLVKSCFPGLAEALASVGAPTLQQRVGTLAGNLCLETRCIYFNQSEFWRSALAPCFKNGGEVCHPGGTAADRCRSVCASDGAAMLAALNGEFEVAGEAGLRRVPWHDFYTGKGEAPFALEPDELVQGVYLDLPEQGFGNAYYKMASRKTLDFAFLSAAANLVVQDGLVQKADLVLGSVFAAPLVMKEAAQFLLGKPPDKQNLARVADLAGKHGEVFLIDNMGVDLDWRKKMLRVCALRALNKALKRVEEGGDHGA
jgi:CO/xanthine dehydrogenase FAD-binding subunit